MTLVAVVAGGWLLTAGFMLLLVHAATRHPRLVYLQDLALLAVAA